MSENLENTNELRKYLLGQIADSDASNRIEERLLTDREFFGELESVEEELIEDYAANLLAGGELESFQRLFLNVPQRREKIRLTRALRELAREENLKKKERTERTGFFGGWILSPRFAFGLLILCAAVAVLVWQFGFKQNETDEALFAELRSMQKNERALESRIADFQYAPLVVLRGTDRENKNRLERRKVELDLREAVRNNPASENLDRLASFYLIEKRFDEAAAQFEKAIEANPQNAKIRSDAGANLYEKAKMQSADDKLKTLDKSLQELNKAIELDPNLPDAVFNKALVLQELNLPKEAAIVWKQYLEKDANSKWADEARANLQRLEEN